MDKVEIAKETLQNYIDKRYSQTQIAVELGVSQGTVFKKMKEYGLKTKTKQSTYDEQVVIKMLQMHIKTDCRIFWNMLGNGNKLDQEVRLR